MSRFIPISIPQESNLPLIIQFTLTSPTYTRQARINALQGLINRCTRAIDTCLEASDVALASIDEGDKHRARLNAIRAELPADVYRGLTEATEQVKAYSQGELEAIGRNLRELRNCKRDAEQGRECGFFIFPPLV